MRRLGSWQRHADDQRAACAPDMTLRASPVILLGRLWRARVVLVGGGKPQAPDDLVARVVLDRELHLVPKRAQVLSECAETHVADALLETADRLRPDVG